MVDPLYASAESSEVGPFGPQECGHSSDQDKLRETRVPAKRSVSLAARERTKWFDNPELTWIQLVPLLVDRNAPPALVPAKRSVPDAASAVTVKKTPNPEFT